MVLLEVGHRIINLEGYFTSISVRAQFEIEDLLALVLLLGGLDNLSWFKVLTMLQK